MRQITERGRKKERVLCLGDLVRKADDTVTLTFGQRFGRHEIYTVVMVQAD
jgi:hypothetical protein